MKFIEISNGLMNYRQTRIIFEYQPFKFWHICKVGSSRQIMGMTEIKKFKLQQELHKENKISEENVKGT